MHDLCVQKNVCWTRGSYLRPSEYQAYAEATQVRGPGLLREQCSSIFLQLTEQFFFDIGHFFKEEVFHKEKEHKMNQHIGQYFLRHVFQNHLHAYLPAGNTTQFIYFSICTIIESLNESLKNDEEPTPTAAYHRTHNSYCDKQQWLRYTLFHSHASKGPLSHIYEMR